MKTLTRLSNPSPTGIRAMNRPQQTTFPAKTIQGDPCFQMRRSLFRRLWPTPASLIYAALRLSRISLTLLHLVEPLWMHQALLAYSQSLATCPMDSWFCSAHFPSPRRFLLCLPWDHCSSCSSYYRASGCHWPQQTRTSNLWTACPQRMMNPSSLPEGKALASFNILASAL